MNMYEAHNQWANRPPDQRFKSLEELGANVKSRRARSRSQNVDIADLKVYNPDEDEGMLISYGKEELDPTHWSFGQLCSQCGVPAAYLRRLPAPLAKQNLAWGLEVAKSTKEEFKLLILNPENGEYARLQALTGRKYGRIWDADVVDCAARIVERTNGRFYNPKAYSRETGTDEPAGLYASDHDVFIFMIDGGSLLEVGPRAKLNRGFIMTNSETGARTFTLTTFLFNVVCGNHIIWGAQDVNKLIIRHTENGPYRFDQEAAPLLLEYATRSSEVEAKVVLAAQERIIANDDQGLREFLSDKGFTRVEAQNAIVAARVQEGDCRSLWNIVQGLTTFAKTYDFIDSRVDLETRAGKLLKLVETA